MNTTLPISPLYRSPIFEAVALQCLVALLSSLMLDGGILAQTCGMALIAFWMGTALMIWRRPRTPTRTDLELIRFGYLPLAVLAFFLAHGIWQSRGVL